MTRDDIIRMAREAKLPACHATHPVALERFAALVAASEREAIADELEHGFEDGNGFHAIYARAIRARSEQ